MAIRGSSLDPVQQSLDTANAMGSVAASNKEVKKAVESLKASLTEASKKNQSTVDRMMASVDRSTAAMIEYFKTQRSADLIKKSNEQVKATSALASTQNDKTKQNAADAEVDKYVKNSDEINKNLKATATAFNGALGKIQELLGDKKVLLQDNSNLEKLTEAIKSGKVNGLNSFARMTGINVKGMDKNVIAPLVSELINAVKNGKTLEQAVTEPEPSNTVEEPAETKESEEKKPEDVVGIIPEVEFRKKICEYIDAENEKREEEEREKKKEKKEADKKHRTIKELLEESNLLSKIGVLGNLTKLITELLPWLLMGYELYSIVKDFRNSWKAWKGILKDQQDAADIMDRNTTYERFAPLYGGGLTHKGKEGYREAQKTNVETQAKLKSGDTSVTVAGIGKKSLEEQKKHIIAWKVQLHDAFSKLVDNLKKDVLKHMAASSDDFYKKVVERRKWYQDIFLSNLDNQYTHDFKGMQAQARIIVSDIAYALQQEYQIVMDPLEDFIEIKRTHDMMVLKAVETFNNTAAWGNSYDSIVLPGSVGSEVAKEESREFQQRAIQRGRQAISDSGYGEQNEIFFGPQYQALKRESEQYYKPRTFEKAMLYKETAGQDVDLLSAIGWGLTGAHPKAKGTLIPWGARTNEIPEQVRAGILKKHRSTYDKRRQSILANAYLDGTLIEDALIENDRKLLDPLKAKLDPYVGKGLSYELLDATILKLGNAVDKFQQYVSTQESNKNKTSEGNKTIVMPQATVPLAVPPTNRPIQQ